MNTRVAKPGDTMIITVDGFFKGHKFVVIECPEKYKNTEYSHYPWFKTEDGGTFYASDPKTYEIVEQTTDADTDVDESLKRQLNDNLAGVFS